MPTNGEVKSPKIISTGDSEQADRSLSIASGHASPASNPRTSKTKKIKARPLTKRLSNVGTPKLIFSVDDDVADKVVADFSDSPDELTKPEKRYLEGYHDALRHFYQQKKNSLEQLNHASPGEENPDGRHTSNLLEQVPPIEIREEHQPWEAEEGEEPLQLGDEEEAEGMEDAGSQHSTSSSETIESLNLRDRQIAINSTHPFGIKIWKPSIYKKNRSVATRAEEDIHDFDPRRPNGHIYWGVHVSNFLWSCTVGLFLYIICLLGSLLLFVLTGFAWHKQSRPYAKLLIKLGEYWLFPFGKFVLLNKDENYLEEDELDGRTISEFHQWRSQEEGRLFFAPPRRMTNSESRPLLKDHKGRPLRDAYSSLGDDQRAENAVDDDADNEEPTDIKLRLFGRGSWSSGRFLFYVFFYGVLQPILYIIAGLCWLFVFTIPITNLTSIMCDHLRRRPLALHFEKEKTYYEKIADPQRKRAYKHQSIILCTYRCCGLHYYKYTIDGTNIFFINLLVVVFFVIFDYFVFKESLGWEKWFTDASFIFCSCLFSIIPLAYFIGQAVASISAQSSMGVGAVINAFFSTIVEIFLYCVALNQKKAKLVEGSMIGSILGGVLLLPGLSMCGGALKRKTQRYNPRSAGVSSTMLLFAMVTMFAPSLFHQMYGSYEIRCKKGNSDKRDWSKCRFIQPPVSTDHLYYSVLRPFSILVALALFAAYVCGLFFTLRTHASLIWATNSHEQQAMQSKLYGGDLTSPSLISLDLNNSKVKPAVTDSQQPPSGVQQSPSVSSTRPSLRTGETSRTRVPTATRQPSHILLSTQPPKEDVEAAEEGGGHDAPNWSQKKSTVILLGATILYAIIAEILVDNVDAVLSHFPINPKFLGLTVFALVPNTTEFVNAISFAVSGNVALSMEIGSAYALQVVLIQIPSLVIYSIFKNFESVDKIFSLIFPRWDIIATLISIYLFTYIYAEGKSNYFKGVILILIYGVVLVGFYLDDVVAELDDGFVGSEHASVLLQLLSR
ncbi:hypothetical protein CLUG_03472 [Clavispora lusitaniae ATCC 42720]|uniref:Low affinity vacuolar monovalent cation/H(+) antiporter n=1 Tax=Clavispora lusitaniae (strain ATCC 42720) TaxID=306902 RepID=C4Y5N8_CLAL4|nr:uncharacterized protein CLUG_03472 [Clavispora lusitaniae ATCC 42720]EEQ39344.1 hypothetical protein CLUG_03472 [Clavispora lusitaniae ATCC 42720]